MIDRTVSHYRILEHLGGGGMGIVYKAEDTRLKRTVALKFLSSELTTDFEAKARFNQEAQAASSLQHANICVVYDIGETDDGQLFICMKYLAGETLKKRVKRGAVTTEEAIDIAIQVAQGLARAHEHGIIHRDIKPANVMITADGVAKIVDFGLAKLSGLAMQSRTGSTLGTAAYMSPEQVRGETVDERTNIWALGVVLYEILSGKRPFRGEHEAAILYSIVNETPEPLTPQSNKVLIALERIVGKALTKDVSGRYPHIADMLADLQALSTETPGRGVPRMATPKRVRRKVIIAAVAVSAVIIIAAAIATLPNLLSQAGAHKERGADHDRKMLVVLPFENLGSPDDEYFANGTTDAITARLAGVIRLGVISRQSAIQYRKTTKSIRQIGSELGVDYILEGTVQRERPGDTGSRVRVIPQLIRVSDDTHVWADKYDEDMKEVFRVQSDIAERVATNLNVALLEPERRAMEKQPTNNLVAYEEYMRGMEHYFSMTSLSDAELSVRQLENAVSLDPRFAEAWAGLAMAYHNLYWSFDRPGTLIQEKEAAKRAEQLAPEIPESHLALGYVDYAARDFENALTHFETALRLRPSGDAVLAIGYTLRRMGRWQEALNHFEDGSRLIPHSYNTYFDCLGYTNSCLRRFDEAEQNFNQAIALEPQVSHGYLFKAYVALAKSGATEAARKIMVEMSHRADIADAAEDMVTQGFEQFTELRVLPDVYTTIFKAFESGRMERFRGNQPAVVATTHLGRALIIEALEGRRSAMALYDSARRGYETIIQSNPQSAYVCSYHSGLGIAYAGLGRKADAIRKGKEAVLMVPMSKDAIVGGQLLRYLAEIYVMCGEYESALDQIQTLLSVPGYVSVGMLRVDPIWDPVRDHPRFRRLIEGSRQ